MDKTYTCQCCGKPYIKTLVPDAYLGNNCFDCSFWLRKIDYSEDWASRRAIIDGWHYIAYPETNDFFKGCGGRRFVIQFSDGHVLETTNLWCQGPIDERFRSRLPDNAVFLPIDEKPDLTDRIPGIPF